MKNDFDEAHLVSIIFKPFRNFGTVCILIITCLSAIPLLITVPSALLFDKQQTVVMRHSLGHQYLESLLSPSRRSTPLPVHHTRKRRRLQEAVARLTTSPVAHNRRSSVSDAGLLSVSGSFLDCTTSPTTHIPDSKCARWEDRKSC